MTATLSCETKSKQLVTGVRGMRKRHIGRGECLNYHDGHKIPLSILNMLDVIQMQANGFVGEDAP